MSLPIIIVACVIIGLSIFNVINLNAPISLNKETINCIFDAGLGTSRILIAVVIILLSIFLSQDLKDRPAGSNISKLIWSLTLAIIASLFVSIFALYLGNFPGSEILTLILVNIFFAIIIVIVSSIFITVYNVLK